MTLRDTRKKCFAALAALTLATPSWAHDDDLRSGNLKPRVGEVSEAVARQKLAIYGIKNVTEIKREGDHYLVKALYNGKPTQMTLHAQTGLLADKATGAHLAPAIAAQGDVIRERQLKIERSELVRPELITPPR